MINEVTQLIQIIHVHIGNMYQVTNQNWVAWVTESLLHLTRPFLIAWNSGRSGSQGMTDIIYIKMQADTLRDYLSR